MYSLICRHAKVGLIPSVEHSENNVDSNLQPELLNNQEKGLATSFQSKLEKSKFAKYFLLLATMVSTGMVIGDGILTPCISG